MVRIKLQHIGIGTKDPEGMCKWYCDVFGFEKILEIPVTKDRSFIPVIGVGGNDTIVIEFIPVLDFNPLTGGKYTEEERSKGINKDDKRDMSSIGVNHICFVVDNFEEISKRLKENGADYINVRTTSESSGGLSQAMLSDPDGNLIEISYQKPVLTSPFQNPFLCIK